MKEASVFLTVGIADFGDSITIVQPEDADKVREYAPCGAIRKSLNIDHGEFEDVLRKLEVYLDYQKELNKEENETFAA